MSKISDFDFPCSQTFRDYYNLISDDGDRQDHSQLTRQQMIDKGLLFPIEAEPEQIKPRPLGFADSREVRASINHLEHRINRLEDKPHGFRK